MADILAPSRYLCSSSRFHLEGWSVSLLTGIGEAVWDRRVRIQEPGR